MVEVLVSVGEYWKEVMAEEEEGMQAAILKLSARREFVYPCPLKGGEAVSNSQGRGRP